MMIKQKYPNCKRNVLRCDDCGYFQCYVCGKFAYWDENCSNVMESDHPPKDKNKLNVF